MSRLIPSLLYFFLPLFLFLEKVYNYSQVTSINTLSLRKDLFLCKGHVNGNRISLGINRKNSTSRTCKSQRDIGK